MASITCKLVEHLFKFFLCIFTPGDALAAPSSPMTPASMATGDMLKPLATGMENLSLGEKTKPFYQVASYWHTDTSTLTLAHWHTDTSTLTLAHWHKILAHWHTDTSTLTLAHWHKILAHWHTDTSTLTLAHWHKILAHWHTDTSTLTLAHWHKILAHWHTSTSTLAHSIAVCL